MVVYSNALGCVQAGVTMKWEAINS